MALSLKDPETDRLARELAQRTGVSLTAAIRHALRDKLAELQTRDRAMVDAKVAAVMEIAARFSARPILDDRSDDEIMGWTRTACRHDRGQFGDHCHSAD